MACDTGGASMTCSLKIQLVIERSSAGSNGTGTDNSRKGVVNRVPNPHVVNSDNANV